MQPTPAKLPRLVTPEDSPSAVTHTHWHTHADGTRHRHPHAHGPGPSHLHPHPTPPDAGVDATRTHDPDHDHDHDHALAHDHDQEHGHDPSATPSEAAPSPGRPADTKVLELSRPVLARNDRLAERNRGYLKAKKVAAVNLVSGPGAGKTTLLEHSLRALGTACPAAVIVGDLATTRDAERLRAGGAPVVQITTGTACHLDAEMVARGLERLDLDDRRLLLIENVGNLVCPADFDLGEDLRVALLSVTEGEDKPLKYPPLFRSADAVVITKIDLSQACGIDLALLRRNVQVAAPGAVVFELSARTGSGMESWLTWLRRAAGATA